MSGPADEAPGTAGDSGNWSRVGWVRYFFADDRWEWSDEVARIHGYEPGGITPTTDVVMSHKHPEDRPKIAELLTEIQRTREAFSTKHRIIDAHGRVHHVVVVGNQLRDDDGEVIGSDGFYIDLTQDVRATQSRISEDVGDIAARRSVIDQAKGMLMLIYAIDEDAAFDLLRWRSQQTNVKLRDLAQQITVDFLAVSHDDRLPTRPVYDGLLMTAHHRLRQS